MFVDYYISGETPPGLKDQSVSFLNTETSISSKVILIEISEDSFKLLNSISPENHHNVKYIYIHKKPLVSSLSKWAPLFNLYKPFCFIEFHSKHLKEQINQAKEEILKFDQNAELIKLKEQNKKNIKQQIQNSDEAYKKLLRARQRTLQNKKNEQINLNCIEIIFNSESIPAIEESLSEILHQSLSITWTRILTNPSEVLTDLTAIKFQNQFTTLTFDLEIESKVQGKVIFAKKQNHTFKKDEKTICQNISDALSLRIRQIITEKRINNIRQQWNSTFNAIPFKTALISQEYDVIKIGGKFKRPESTKNLKCYQLFWGRNSPCAKCKLGENFLIDHKNESLEVNSKRIFDPTTEENFYLNFYRDFDMSLSQESGDLSLSKLEELGLICGSIAHELNNPLGGIKILLDLIKDEPENQNSEDQNDIQILKQSTEHCIDTIKELLNFTRKQKDPKATNLLIENINQVKIFTRAFLQSSGYEIKVLESPLLSQEVFTKNSTLTIRLLEMISQFVNKLNDHSYNQRQIFLWAELNSSELKLILSVVKPLSDESSQQTPDSSPLYLDPKEISFNEKELESTSAYISFTTRQEI